MRACRLIAAGGLVLLICLLASETARTLRADVLRALRLHQPRATALPHDFCWESYALLNPELHITNRSQAVASYLQYGWREGRLYKR